MNRAQIESLIHETLTGRFKIPAFRTPQQEIVTAILENHDVLALLPTGAGKSLCYQLPACLLPGLTIVISPLLSLMNDQVDKLRSLKISAAALTSQKSPIQQSKILQSLRKNGIKILYLSPEKLQTKKWQTFLATIPVSLVVVDEAHCIEMWGDIFRPHYLQIADFIQSLPNRPTVAAFTATATSITVNRIIKVLMLNKPEIFRMSTRKQHLQIIIQACQNQNEKALTLMSYLINRRRLPAIIYCATRNAVEELTGWLQQFFTPFFTSPYVVIGYHGGLTTEQRISIERTFIANHADILVATNAFGMGVDKPNTRLVIHWQLPSSIENYYQEIGRAGRDRLPAQSVLCFSKTDIKTQQRMSNSVKKDGDTIETQKLTTLIKMLASKTCLNQSIEKYFNDPDRLPPCKRCSHCNLIQPLLKTDFQLRRILATILSKKIAGQILTFSTTIDWLTVVKPTTYDQLQCIPGVGRGWIKNYSAVILIICRLHKQSKLIADKLPTNQFFHHEQIAELG